MVDAEVLTDFASEGQMFHGFARTLEVGRHCVFATAETPNMEVMNLHLLANVGQLLFQRLTINSIRCSLHKDVDAVSKGLLAGVADHDGEE